MKGQLKCSAVTLLSLGICFSFQSILFFCVLIFFKLEIQGAQRNKVVRFPNSTGLWLSGPSSSGCLIPKMRLERILKKSPFKFAYRLSLIYSSVNMKPWAKPPFIYFSGKKEMTLFNSITNFSILWKVTVCF